MLSVAVEKPRARNLGGCVARTPSQVLWVTAVTHRAGVFSSGVVPSGNANPSLGRGVAPALVHFPRSQKTGVSVRVMRETPHRLVIFLSGTIKKKMLEKARFADSTYGARLFRYEKVAEARPSARLGASTDPIKNRGENPLWW